MHQNINKNKKEKMENSYYSALENSYFIIFGALEQPHAKSLPIEASLRHGALLGSRCRRTKLHIQALMMEKRQNFQHDF